MLRLRSHLIILVLAVLVPAMAFGAIAAWDAVRRQDREAEGALLDSARALAAAIDTQIGGQIAALRVLAAGADIDGTDAAHFRAHAENTANIFGGWVTLYERDGTQVMNTRVPPGMPLPGVGSGAGAGLAGLERTFTGGQPVVTDLVVGRTSGQMMGFVFVPITRGGEVWRVLGMPLLSEQLSSTLAARAGSPASAVALTDGNGAFVARSRDAERIVGQNRPVRGDGPIGDSGVLRGQRMVDGDAIRTAYQRLSGAPGWHVWVNELEATFAAARRAPMLALAAGGVLALLIGLATAMALCRRLLRPVEALVAHAEAVASGEVDEGAPAPAVPPARVAEFERLRRTVAGSEAALRRVQRIGRVGGFDIDLRTGVNRRSAEYMHVQGRGGRAQIERHEDWIRRLHPEDRDRAERRFLDAISDDSHDTDYAQEYRIVTPEGATRWIYARAEIERDAAGRALRMVGAHVDVTALKAAEAALRDSEERLRLAVEAAQLGTWEVDFATGQAHRTPRALEIFGFGSEVETAVYPSWRDRVHPDDRDRLARVVQSVRTGETQGYRIEYRFLRPDGRWIWVESHGHAAGRDPLTGTHGRLIGTTQDITERKEAEERQEVLINELDHRAKNTLAVVQAALRLTPRHNASAFARAVEGRVNALARAHTLLAQARWRGAPLRTVAEDAVAPFTGSGGAGPTATVHGPPVALSPTAVQALSMSFHELATNAAKHGALSVPGGRVTLAWKEAGDMLHISWHENGGPQLAAPPASRGFGSSLVAATVERQLGGRLDIRWDAAGLVWEAWLPIARLTTEPGSGESEGALPDKAGRAGAAVPEAAAPAL